MIDLPYKKMCVEIYVPAQAAEYVRSAMLKAGHQAMTVAYGTIEGKYDDVSDFSRVTGFPCFGCKHQLSDGYPCNMCSRLGHSYSDQWEEMCRDE